MLINGVIGLKLTMKRLNYRIVERKKMIKNIKKIMLLVIAMAFFMPIPIVAETKDCSHLVKLHKKLMCKAGSDSYDSGTSESTTSGTSESTTSGTSESTTKAKKVKKVKEANPESINVKYNTFGKILKKMQE